MPFCLSATSPFFVVFLLFTFFHFVPSPVSVLMSTSRKRKSTFEVHKSLIYFHQLNCQKSLVPTSFLQPVLKEQTPFIAIISEPPLKRKDSRIDGFPYTYPAFYMATSGPPRAAIVTSSCFAPISSTLSGFSNSDMITVRFENLVVSSLYCHPKSHSIPEELPSLIDWCEIHSLKLIICGDFNAHHHTWGSKKDTPRGNNISDLINEKNIFLLNTGSSPTWSNRELSSIIDLSLCSANIFADISDWKVSINSMMSDHNLISFNLNRNKHNKRPRTSTTIKRDLLDFDKLKSDLSIHLQHTDWDHQANNLDDLNYKALALHNAMSASIKSSTTSHFSKDKNCDVLWWNEELDNNKEALKDAQSNFDGNKSSDELYRDLSEAKSNLYKSIRKAKIDSFKKFCSSRNNKQASKLLKQLESNSHLVRFSCPSIRDRDDNHFGNDYDTLTHIVDELTPGTSYQSIEEIPKTGYDGLPRDLNTYISQAREVENICSSNRIKELLFNINKNSAPGPDNISYKTLAYCWEILEEPVRAIFLDCLMLGALPDMWLNSSAVFIPKPNVKVHTLPKHYRTINLSPCILKCLEKIILWHLEIDLNLDKFLHPLQFGFRKGKSCDHAISNLVTKIEGALINRGIALGIFIDISGAFDNVSTEFILKVLRNSPISQSVYNVICYLLSNRRVLYSLGKATLIRLLLKGFAQGGRLSPTLWNLVADVVLKDVNINIQEFLQALADDLASIIAGNDITNIRKRAQLVLNAIERWCLEAGLQINTSKSVIVIFTHRRYISLDQHLTYCGTPLPVQTSVRYLGVHLDSKLSWSVHIQNKLIAVNIQQSKLKVITARHWGLSPATVSWVYKSMTRPKLLYGSYFWASSATQSKTNHNKLQKICNTAARSVVGVSKSSPLAPTLALANLEPLNLSINCSALATHHRLSSSLPSDPSLKSKGKFTPHTLHSHHLLHSILGDDNTPSDRLSTPFYNVDRKFSVHTEASIDMSSFQSIPNCSLIFTDGSKSSDGTTGSGWAIFNSQNPDEPKCEKIRISNHSSVFQAEIFAICSAVASLLISSTTINPTTHIFSDSQSSLHALTNHYPTSTMVVETIQHLNSLSLQSSVNLHWVRGHSGVAGNELADTLAKEATSLDTIGKVTPAPYSFFKHKLKVWSFTQSKNSIDSASTSNKLHRLVSSLHRPESSSLLLKASSADLHKLTNILSNRAPLNAFLFRINKSSSDICPRCKIEAEDNVHFLCHCPFFFNLRSKFFGFPVINIQDLLKLNPFKILSFIKNSGIFENF